MITLLQNILNFTTAGEWDWNNSIQKIKTASHKKYSGINFNL